VSSGLHFEAVGQGGRVVALAQQGGAAFGLLAGDTIVAIEGRAVSGAQDGIRLAEALRAGRALGVTVRRGGATCRFRWGLARPNWRGVFLDRGLASMRWVRVWSWVGLVALALPAPAFAQYRLNVREADVRAFIADAAEVTGRTFIVDARVTGKVSVASERVLSASEYFEVFLATLRANGLVAVPTGNGAFRIQPMEGAAAQPTINQAGARGISARNQMVTEVIRLRTIDVAQALEALRPLVGKDGALTANKTGNSLVVVDYADNVARLRALARQLDQDRAGFLTIDLAHLGAREMATALGQLIASGEGGRAMATVVPVESANAVALRGEPTVLAGLAQIARRLDAQAGGTGAGAARSACSGSTMPMPRCWCRCSNGWPGAAGARPARGRRRRFRWVGSMGVA
jgi:hypothetical protein